MKYLAYWVSPYGDIIPLSADRHINEIWDHPDKFGLTIKELEAVYKKHGERRGGEGNAREEVMGDLIRDGWSRIRYIIKSDSFMVQVGKLDKRTKENIYDWAKVAIKKDDVSKYTGVTLMEIKPGGDTLTGILDDIVRYKMFEESTRTRKPTKAMIFIEDFIAKK